MFQLLAVQPDRTEQAALPALPVTAQAALNTLNQTRLQPREPVGMFDRCADCRDPV